LQGIPDLVYEAAAIDIVDYWRRLRRISMPLLAPVLEQARPRPR
jgi:ABC-type sugar transport system permease subunit